jgi:hypothetical protein
MTQESENYAMNDEEMVLENQQQQVDGSSGVQL